MRASGRVLASHLSEQPCQAACTASAAYSTTAEPAQAGSGVAQSSAVLGGPPQTEEQPGQGLSQAEPSGSGRAREGLHRGRPAQQHAHGVSQAEPSGSGGAGDGWHWRWLRRQQEHRLGQAEASDSGRASRAAAAGASLGRAWPVRDADDPSSSDEAEPAEPERELRDTDQAAKGFEGEAMEPRGSMARVLASWWAEAQRIGLHKAKFFDVVLALHKAARLLDVRQAKHFAGLAVREMVARQDELAGMRVEKLVRLLKGPRIGGDKLYLTDLMRGLQPMLIGRMHEFAEAELLELMQALRRQVCFHAPGSGFDSPSQQAVSLSEVSSCCGSVIEALRGRPWLANCTINALLHKCACRIQGGALMPSTVQAAPLLPATGSIMCCM